MNNNHKKISLDLAKFIDTEHKRLGIVVGSEWFWLNGELRWGGTILEEGDVEYPAYDTSELGELFPRLHGGMETIWKAGGCVINYWESDGVDSAKLYQFEGHTEAEARGKMYLWLLKEELIK